MLTKLKKCCAPGQPRARVRAVLALLVGILSVVVTAAAQAKPLDAAPMSGKKIRIDGMLREWPKLQPLAIQISGRGEQTDPKAKGVVAYDEKRLYVAMSVRDRKIVRSSNFGANEDHAVFRIAFPRKSGAHKSYNVLLYPGVPGKSAGRVKLTGLGKIPGAKIVEAPEAGGLLFEASIPWKVFPEARTTRVGLKGALLYKDADRLGKITAIVGTSGRTGGAMPSLTLEAEYSLNQGLVLAKGLKPKPLRERVGNVVGDKMLERVAVYDRYLTVTGWNYRGGSEYYFHDLKTITKGSLKRFSLVDLTGEGRLDIVIQRVVGTSGKSRELFEVWRFRASDDGPQLVFQHEVGIKEKGMTVNNQVKLKRRQGKLGIVVSQGNSKNIDVAAWEVTPRGGFTQPTLLPWQGIKSRRYEWRAERFELIDEQVGTPKMKGPQRGTRLWSGKRPPRVESRSPASTEESLVESAPPPRPPSPEELMDKVYALYRADRGVRKSKPRFDFVTNVAAGEATERVLIHGKDIVVFGKGFKAGSSYAFSTIGVKSARDILSVTGRDLTGDGRAEIIVRGLLKVKASKRLGGQQVTRHALFIYKVRESGIVRIFAAETGRSVRKDAILGQVAFLPSGRGLQIELRPGRAIGWREGTYPFPEDRFPYGGLEPLLLPWTDLPVRRYVYSGSKYQLRE